MSDKPVIFISYSSKDENSAASLKEQLEACFDNHVNIFMAKFSIAPSQDWLDEIVRNLDLAQAIVILMTPNSKNSYWVGFEIGYLYPKINRAINKLLVYPLCRPQTEIFGPFWRTHGTLLDDPNELKSFFERLCQQFESGDINRIDVNAIVAKATNQSDGNYDGFRFDAQENSIGDTPYG